MTRMSCRAAEKMLPALHDGELPMSDQVMLEAHLDGCAACASETQRLDEIGAALRAVVATRRSKAPDLGGVQANVVVRMGQERHRAWSSRLMRLVDDPHLIWAACGATAAAIVCVAIACATLYFAAPRRADSLAGILSVLASPGSNENPVRPGPTVTFPKVDPLATSGMLLRTVSDRQDDVYALGAVLTAEGRLIDLEVLGATDRSRRDATRLLLDVASTARFEPARIGRTPVALSVVWVMVHTTVTGQRG